MLKPKYFLYARKSTEDDDHQIMSIEAQLFELREYARRENVEIIQEFIEAKSAKKPGREKFAEMINEIEKSDGVGILSWHPDRLARNSVDGGKVIYLVDTQKIVSCAFRHLVLTHAARVVHVASGVRSIKILFCFELRNTNPAIKLRQSKNTLDQPSLTTTLFDKL